jgi:hypothetical protein
MYVRALIFVSNAFCVSISNYFLRGQLKCVLMKGLMHDANGLFDACEKYNDV